MTTATDALTEFLLARIAEDEAEATSIHEASCFVLDHIRFFGWSEENAAHCCGHPARVLAECEAKRRIVEMHDGPDGVGWPCCAPRWTEPDENRHVWFVGCWTTMTLAAVYADHEDFREEWAL